MRPVQSHRNGLLSTCTCNGAFCVSLPFVAVLKARPVPKDNAAPPSKSTLNLSGLSDLLVMNSFVRLVEHFQPMGLMNALLEHYKVLSQFGVFFVPATASPYLN
jgi:hypothetical protein